MNEEIRLLEENYIKKYLSPSGEAIGQEEYYKYFNPRLVKHLFDEDSFYGKSQFTFFISNEDVIDSDNTFESNLKDHQPAFELLCLLSVCHCPRLAARILKVLSKTNIKFTGDSFLHIFCNWGHVTDDKSDISGIPRKNALFPNEYCVTSVFYLLQVNSEYFSSHECRIILNELFKMVSDSKMRVHQFILGETIGVVINSIVNNEELDLTDMIKLYELPVRDAIHLCVNILPIANQRDLSVELSYNYLFWILTSVKKRKSKINMSQLYKVMSSYKGYFPDDGFVIILVSYLLSNVECSSDQISKITNILYLKCKNHVSEANRLKNWWLIQNTSKLEFTSTGFSLTFV